MQLYKTQVKKYASDADIEDGIVAYGWTTAALFVKTLELSAEGRPGNGDERGPHPARA